MLKVQRAEHAQKRLSYVGNNEASCFLSLLYVIVKQKWFEKISSTHIIWICLGVLRTLVFNINFRQLAINVHKYCVLAHAFSPQRAEARLEEEMFINGYALKTR